MTVVLPQSGGGQGERRTRTSHVYHLWCLDGASEEREVGRRLRSLEWTRMVACESTKVRQIERLSLSEGLHNVSGDAALRSLRGAVSPVPLVRDAEATPSLGHGWEATHATHLYPGLGRVAGGGGLNAEPKRLRHMWGWWSSPMLRLWLALMLVGMGHAQRAETYRRMLDGSAPPPPYRVHSASLDDLIGTTTGTDIMHRPPLPPAMTGPFPPGSMDSIKPGHMPPVRTSRALPKYIIAPMLRRGSGCLTEQHIAQHSSTAAAVRGVAVFCLGKGLGGFRTDVAATPRREGGGQCRLHGGVVWDGESVMEEDVRSAANPRVPSARRAFPFGSGRGSFLAGVRTGGCGRAKAERTGEGMGLV